MPAPESRDYSLIERLADEFAARHRRGERPTVQEYIDRHPDLADDLREMLPAMAELEKVREVLADPPPGPAVLPPPDHRLGDFRILREVGHGGMGVVYEAEQLSLGRRVALKVLTRKMLADPKQKRRFEREAKAAARLHHTNIVPVFGFGEADGVPFYVMQFIQGLGIDQVIRELVRIDPEMKTQTGGDEPPTESPRDPSAAAVARSLLTGEFNPADDAPTVTCAERLDDPSPTAATESAPSVPKFDGSATTSSVTLPGQAVGGGRGQLTYWQSVARIGAQAADALDYAHRQGIVHRDVKPSNLLLDLAGTVWVADFGLAKADDQQDLTHTGDILGTLRYMAPEAFEGKADARADVYGLGLTLYELLALRPALGEKDRHKLIRQVTEADLPRLRKVRPGVPRDLDTIVHKATDRDPGRRYQTAGELAADLQRFVNDEPIRARRQTAAEAAWRWARRHKAMAALLAVFAVLLVAATVGSLALAAHFRQQEAAQRELVQEKGELAERNQKLAEDNEAARQTTERALRQAETTLVDMRAARGFLAAERDDPALAVLWFAAAAEQAATDPRRAADNRLRARNWTRDAVLPVGSFPVGHTPVQLDFRPGAAGGDLLLARTVAGRLVAWDWQRGVSLPWADGITNVAAARWTPDGTALAVGLMSGEVQVRSVPDGTLLHTLKHPAPVTALAYDPSGRHLAVAGRSARVWDTVAHEFLTIDCPHPELVTAMAFTATGDRLATACQDAKARVFAVGAGPLRPEPLFNPVHHEPGFPSPPAFVNDDRGLVTVTGSNEVSWWDAETGARAGFRSVKTPVYYLRGVAAGPDGKWFATWGGDGAVLWPAAGGGAKPVELKHRNAVRECVFGTDEKTVLTVSWDQTARLWSLPEGKPIGAPLLHAADLAGCALSADGTLIAAGAATGHVRVWKRPTAASAPRLATPGNRARLSPDGRLVAPGQWHEMPTSAAHLGTLRVRVLEAASGNPAGPAVSTDDFLVDSCVCADNRTVAVASGGDTTGQLGLYDVPTGRPLFPPRDLPSAPVSVAARPNSPHVAVLCRAGQLLVVDSRTGGVVHDLRHDGWVATAARWPRVEYTPDGTSLVTLTDRAPNEVHVRDAATGRPRYPPIRPVIEGGPCRTFALSADGKLLATGVNGKNAARVWDVATGRPLSAPLPHPGDFYGLFGLVFSPDGRRLLTASKDGQARLWDWAAGTLACPPMPHPDEVHGLAFTPDGRYALTGGRNQAGAVHVWELATGKPVAPPVRLGTRVNALALSPDGGHAFASLDAATARVNLSDLLTPPTRPAEDYALLGELASGQRIELGDVSVLTGEHWLERWGRYARAFAEPAPSLAEALARAAPHREAARTLTDAGRTVEALARWRQAAGEIDRAGGGESERRAVRADILTEARTALARRVADKPADGAAAGVLADLLLESREPTEWVVLTPDDATSDAGATLARLPDGSVLAGGPSPPRDSYTVTTRTALRGVTALRLETLPDPSLARNGPGRGTYGNFCLTEVTLTAAPAAGGKAGPVALTRAAGYQRPMGRDTTVRDGPHGAIDGTHLTRWDIWPNVGKPSALILETAEPIGAGGESVLTVRLDCQHPIYPDHVLGKFRLSATTRPHAVRDENLITLADGADGRVRLATAYIVRGEWTQALGVLEKAGDAPHTRLLLALVREHLGRPGEPGLTLDAALDRLPATAGRRLLLELGVDVISTRIARDPKLDWLLTRCRWQTRIGRTAAAAADLGRVLEVNPATPLRPEYAVALGGLGDAAAAAGDWPAAARYFARAVELVPANSTYWHSHLLLALRSGDVAAYKKRCAELAMQAGDSPAVVEAHNLAWVFSLCPGAADDPAVPVRLAERAAAADPRPAVLNTLGAALYRAGRYDLAVEKLTAAAKGTPPDGTPWDWLFLAMAHHRLGHPEEARAWLGRAAGFVGRVRDGVSLKDRWEQPIDWRRRIELDVLLGEAEALIGVRNP